MLIKEYKAILQTVILRKMSFVFKMGDMFIFNNELFSKIPKVSERTLNLGPGEGLCIYHPMIFYSFYMHYCLKKRESLPVIR
jgi:hypothetical protein